MSTRGAQVLRAALDYLRTLGVTDATVQHGKHAHIRFTWKGENMMVTVGRSPGDPNAEMLKLNDIRRQLGIKRETYPRSDRRAARRHKNRASPPPEVFTL